MQRRLQEGERIPRWYRWYGIAYVDYESRIAILYPVPFYWFVRWSDAIQWRFFKSPEEKRVRSGWMLQHELERLDEVIDRLVRPRQPS